MNPNLKSWWQMKHGTCNYIFKRCMFMKLLIKSWELAIVTCIKHCNLIWHWNEAKLNFTWKLCTHGITIGFRFDFCFSKYLFLTQLHLLFYHFLRYCIDLSLIVFFLQMRACTFSIFLQLIILYILDQRTNSIFGFSGYHQHIAHICPFQHKDCLSGYRDSHHK